MSYLQHPVSEDRPIRVAVFGAGWIGSFHPESVAHRIPNARLEAIADPALRAVEALAGRLGVSKISADPADEINDPEIDAVLIAAPARFHSSLIAAAARAGKDVFCEKPGGRTIVCADAGSPQSSRNQPIKSATGNDAVPPEAGPRSLTRRTTRAGTSSNGTSIPSSSGEAWPLATTNSHSRRFKNTMHLLNEVLDA